MKSPRSQVGHNGIVITLCTDVDPPEWCTLKPFHPSQDHATMGCTCQTLMIIIELRGHMYACNFHKTHMAKDVLQSSHLMYNESGKVTGYDVSGSV